MDTWTKLKGLSYLGWGTLWRSFTYGLRRDALERRHRVAVTGPAQEPGHLQMWEATPRGATLCFAHANLEVAFLAPDLLRVTWTPGALPMPWGVARHEWPPVDVRVAECDLGLTVASDALRVTVGADGSLAVHDAAGHLVRSERRPVRAGEAWTSKAALPPGERVMGLGERTVGLDLRGHRFLNWNREAKGSYVPGQDPLYICLPQYLCLQEHGACALFFENTWQSTFSFEDDHAEATFAGGALRWYLAAGTTEQAVGRLSELTGRAPLPPRWALGFHQARWSYLNEAEVREVADGFRDHDLPLSAIHLDIHYMQGHRVFTMDPARFPDPAGLAAGLDARGVKLVAILDPGVKAEPGYALYDDGVKRGAFCTLPDGGLALAPVWPGTCAFPDFTSDEVREWWGDHYRCFVDWGIAGVWHDMNEPAAFTGWGHPTLPTCTGHRMEDREGGGTHLEAHNAYGLLEDRAGFEALRRLRPDRRPWLLSRSGWTGVQRYAWTWTGDNESNWWSLAQSVRMCLSMGLCGQPYNAPDIGGFGGVPTTELFVRWFQLGSFFPFFRVHSAFFTPRREPWCFGDDVLPILRDALKRRYQLLPYWYTLAWQAATRGTPLCRPLFWADPDPALREIDDAFLVGPDLLVAPILEPGVSGRDVRLPAGTWIDWHNGVRHPGGHVVRVDADVSDIPLFVRAGALVPMDAEGALELHAWPDDAGTAEGTLYHDAGDGYGPWCALTYRLEAGSDAVVLLQRQGDGPAPEPAPRVVVHR